MFDNLTLAIETAAIGLSAFPWILLVLDLLYPKIAVLQDMWKLRGQSWLSKAPKLPGLAAMGFLVAYFLALIITPIADAFFNQDWHLTSDETILIKGDSRIRTERYLKEYKDLLSDKALDLVLSVEIEDLLGDKGDTPIDVSRDDRIR